MNLTLNSNIGYKADAFTPLSVNAAISTRSFSCCVVVDAMFVSNMFLDQGVTFLQGVALAMAIELEVSYFLRFVLATMTRATSFSILIMIVCDNLAGHLVCHSVEKSPI